MKKESMASFIVAIVLVVCAIALNILGFTYINGTQFVRHVSRGMSYYTTVSLTNVSMAMIIVGGFLFIGGILMFMLSAMTRCRHGKHCCHEHRDEAPKAVEEPVEEVTQAEPEMEEPTETN